MGFSIKRDKYDKVVSDLVRYRDKWTCLKCARHYEPFKGLECSHYKSRVHKGTRYDPENCDTLCTGCHAYFQRNAEAYRAWRIQRLGLQKIELLEYKARHPYKLTEVDKVWLYEHLKGELRKAIKAYEQWELEQAAPYAKVPF